MSSSLITPVANNAPLSPGHVVIYDGNCNLCVTFVQLLEQWDRGQKFFYVPMQAETTLAQWQITQAQCQAGMILLDLQNPSHYVQGSTAAEEISRLLPMGQVVVGVYRAWAGLKNLGDALYVQVRDHRYAWFGTRRQTYHSVHGLNSCQVCSGKF